jgi:hypothetical protein
MLPTLSALIIFGRGSHIFAEAGLDRNPLIYVFPYSWDDRHAPPHPTIDQEEVLQTFCQAGL